MERMNLSVNSPAVIVFDHYSLHNYDLENNLITIGNYTIYNNETDELCHEKEEYDYSFNVPATCNSFYVATGKSGGIDFITEQGCLTWGNDCKFLDSCGADWKNWFSAKITNPL